VYINSELSSLGENKQGSKQTINKITKSSAASQEIPCMLWNKFITVFKRACQLSFFSVRSILFAKPPPPTPILFLEGPFQHSPSLGSPSGLFPSGFPTKTLYAPLHTLHVPHATPFPFIFHPLSNKSYIKFHLMVSMKLVLKMVFDGIAHYK
jgi:hypothetical protein